MANLFKVGFLFDVENSWIHSHLSDDLWLSKFKNKFSFCDLWSSEMATNLDVLFILGYTKILPSPILSKNKLNLVIHESALPKGRGFSPVQWQVLDGAKEIPVCLIEASQAADEGDIIASTVIHLVGHELLDEIRRAQAKVTKDLIINFLEDFPNIRRKKQVGQGTYFRRRNRIDDKLDVEHSLISQFNKFRVADNQNYPLFFDLDGFRYELFIRKVSADE